MSTYVYAANPSDRQLFETDRGPLTVHVLKFRTGNANSYEGRWEGSTVGQRAIAKITRNWERSKRSRGPEYVKAEFLNDIHYVGALPIGDSRRYAWLDYDPLPGEKFATVTGAGKVNESA